MPVRDYDVVVVGAGPAGATAAILLRQKGHRVVLVDKARFPRTVPCAGWLNVRAAAMLEGMKVSLDGLQRRSLRQVTFYSADFSKRILPNLKQSPGFLVDRSEFDHALVSAAKRLGVSIIEGAEARSLSLRESSVVVHLESGRDLEGRFLALAAGRAPRILESTGIVRDSHSVPIWSAQVEAALAKGAVASEPTMTIVLGLDRRGSFGLCCVTPDRISLGVHILNDDASVIPALTNLCRLVAERKIAPLSLTESAAKARVHFSPASGALDMETHVAKHTLVFGDSGGFVAAASNEGIYPAMWSARIAAEVFERALEADVKAVPSQDELMRFDSLWRVQMADYLRSPHTDIQFLLPLIFSNQAMADRMATAFFSGENI